jgi:hypothetical protein
MAERTADWGWLKRYCADNQVPDNAVLMMDIDEEVVPVQDIDTADAEEGFPAEGDDPGEPATPPELIFKKTYA